MKTTPTQRSKEKQMAYSREYIKQIKAAAFRVKGATSVSHIRPRAYCVAKPSVCCAVFVTPPEDAEPLVRDSQNATAELIQDACVSDVEVGKWYVLAYVTTPTISQSRVIKMQ